MNKFHNGINGQKDVKLLKIGNITLLLFVLLAFLLSADNYSNWINYDIKNPETISHYMTPSKNFLYLPVFFMIISSLMTMPVVFITNKINMRHLITFVSIVQFLGTMLKVVSIYFSKRYYLPLVCVGNLLYGICNPFLHIILPKFIHLSVRENTELTFLNLITLGDAFGIVVSYGSLLLINEFSQNILQANLLQSLIPILSVIFALIFWLVSRRENKIFEKECLKREENRSQPVQDILFNWKFILVELGFGLSFGIFNSIVIFIPRFLKTNINKHDFESVDVLKTFIFGAVASIYYIICLEKSDNKSTSRKFMKIFSFFTTSLITIILFYSSLNISHAIMVSTLVGIFYFPLQAVYRIEVMKFSPKPSMSFTLGAVHLFSDIILYLIILISLTITDEKKFHNFALYGTSITLGTIGVISAILGFCMPDEN